MQQKKKGIRLNTLFLYQKINYLPTTLIINSERLFS